jgi:hypothetical protein
VTVSFRLDLRFVAIRAVGATMMIIGGILTPETTSDNSETSFISHYIFIIEV